MKTRRYCFLIILMLIGPLCFSQTNDSGYTQNEKINSEFFISFLKYIEKKLSDKPFPIIDSSNETREIKLKNDSLRLRNAHADTADIKYLLSNYIFPIDFPVDYVNTGNTISSTEKFKIAYVEITDLYTFLGNNGIINIEIKPLRLSGHDYDKYIYNRLSEFQKENTFILFNKNSPEKVLNYILFIPAKTIKSSTPRILSWKLGYSFGRFYFIDVLRNSSTEVLWEGVKGPKHPIE